MKRKITLIGVEEVTREALGNGFRFTVVFRAGSPGALTFPSENITEVRTDGERNMRSSTGPR